MHENRHLKSQWLDNVKTLLCSGGYSGIWYSQSFINAKWFTSSFTQKLKDSYIQKWYSSANISSSNNNYRLFKDTFEPSSYIKQLPHFLCRRFMAFRTRNHRFPVELGRWYWKPLNAYVIFVIVIQVINTIIFLHVANLISKENSIFTVIRFTNVKTRS